MIKMMPDSTCSKSIKQELSEILEMISKIKLMDYQIELCAANVHVDIPANPD
jgi:hypothetical protein